MHAYIINSQLQHSCTNFYLWIQARSRINLVGGGGKLLPQHPAPQKKALSNYKTFIYEETTASTIDNNNPGRKTIHFHYNLQV